MITDWINLFKIRIASSQKSMLKHEVVKLILVMKLMDKYRIQKSWIRIYTEFKLENGLKPDVYFENIKTKEVILYEIQKQFTDAWIGRKTKAYNELSIPFFNSCDFIPINLNKLPENINEIWDALDEFVF